MVRRQASSKPSGIVLRLVLEYDLFVLRTAITSGWPVLKRQSGHGRPGINMKQVLEPCRAWKPRKKRTTGRPGGEPLGDGIHNVTLLCPSGHGWINAASDLVTCSGGFHPDTVPLCQPPPARSHPACFVQRQKPTAFENTGREKSDLTLGSAPCGVSMGRGWQRDRPGEYWPNGG